MPYLESLRVFVRVVELGSITSGGRDLRLTPAVASNRVKELESRLGVRRIAFERMRRPLLCLCQLAPRQASQWPLADDFPRLALRGRRIDISAPGKQYHQQPPPHRAAPSLSTRC